MDDWKSMITAGPNPCASSITRSQNLRYRLESVLAAEKAIRITSPACWMAPASGECTHPASAAQVSGRERRRSQRQVDHRGG